VIFLNRFNSWQIVLAAVVSIGYPMASPIDVAAQVADPPPSVLSGRVVLGGQGIPSNPVTLHRITPQESGEVDATVTDSTGAFSFTVAPVAGAEFTVYFATADYLSVRFFGQPLHPDSAGAGEYLLTVYDTASVLPEPVRVTSRDIVMFGELTGGWEVLEVLRVFNPTRFAFVAGDGMPPWEFRLPEDAYDFQVGEGDVLPHELSWMEDRVLQLTPVTPGVREIYVSYRLPRGPSRSVLQIGEPTDTLNIFVRQPSHLSAVSGLETTRMIDSEGEQFLQYGGLALAPGASIVLEWNRLQGAPIDPVLAAVILTLLLLGAGVVAAVRYRSTLD